VGRTRYTLDKDIKEVESHIKMGANERSKDLKMLIRKQNDQYVYLENQMRGMVKEDNEMQQMIDLCNKKLARLEKIFGNAKNKK